MVSITWGPDLAEVYDATYAAGFAPSVLDPIVGLLGALAGVSRAGIRSRYRASGPRARRARDSRAWPGATRPWPSGCSPSPARRGSGDHRRHDRLPVPGDRRAGVPGGQHHHERHHARRSGGSLRQRGRAPGTQWVLRGRGGDHPPAPPGTARSPPRLHPAAGASASDVRRRCGQIAWSHHWIAAEERPGPTLLPTAACSPCKLTSWPRPPAFRHHRPLTDRTRPPSLPTPPRRWPSSRNAPELPC